MALIKLCQSLVNPRQESPFCLSRMHFSDYFETYPTMLGIFNGKSCQSAYLHVNRTCNSHHSRAQRSGMCPERTVANPYANSITNWTLSTNIITLDDNPSGLSISQCNCGMLKAFKWLLRANIKQRKLTNPHVQR